MNLKRVELSFSALQLKYGNPDLRAATFCLLCAPKNREGVFAGNNRETRTWRQTERVPLFLSLHHYVP